MQEHAYAYIMKSNYLYYHELNVLRVYYNERDYLRLILNNTEFSRIINADEDDITLSMKNKLFKKKNRI